MLDRLSLREIRALAVLRAHPGLTLKEISEKLGIAPSTAHGVMTRLLAMDLVERKNGQYFVSNKGEEILKQVKSILEKENATVRG